MSHDENEEYRCSYLSLASVTSDNVNVDHAISVCGRVSSASILCTCTGDNDAMLSCPYWRNVFVQERLWEALMEIAHNVKASGGGKN